MTFEAYLEERKACWQAAEAAAKADDRGDEAVFARIRMNVYAVCATVRGALAKAKGDAFPAAYRAKLRELEAAWSAARETALRHGDSDRVFTEDLKLEALRDVLTRWEEETK